MPQSSLDELITTESIKAGLREAGLSLTLSDQIFESARRVFTVLVYIDMVQAIEDLLQEGFTDNYLPVNYVRVEDRSVMESQDGETKFKSFGHKPWTPKKVKEFYNEQWLV